MSMLNLPLYLSFPLSCSPLPKEMLSYARSDTHFLLYIYDRMRNTLLDKSNPTTHNLLHATLQRSAETSLRRHEKEAYDAEGGEDRKSVV